MRRYQFVRAAAATPRLAIADPAENARVIAKMMTETSAEVIVFPELCTTGYTCGDLFMQKTLLSASDRALDELCAATGRAAMAGKLVFVGAPVASCGRLYNCAVAMANGRILGAVPKSYLPTYGEFYEARWFEPGNNAREDTVRIAGRDVPFGCDLLFCDEEGALCVGAEICEDLWVNVPPSSFLAAAGANVIVNLSASDEVLTKSAYRRQIVSTQSARCICGYVYASSGMDESTSDLVFSGHDLIYDNGQKKAESIYEFGLIEGLIDLERIEHDRLRMGTSLHAGAPMPVRRIVYKSVDSAELPGEVCAYPFVPQNADELAARCAEIVRLQATGLATRLRKTGMKTAVVGISGGLDSTLALIVTAQAFEMCNLPSENIIAITMPGFGTTKRTYDSARELIDCFGATLRIIPIDKACMQHFSDIGHDPDARDVTYENTQARERTQILMDVANQTGGLVVGTGDLSELALGWCTYNGDHMSMYAVNAGVPKTLVQYVIAAYAKTRPQLAHVLQTVLDTPISPELLPPDENGQIAQKTEERIGKYDIHDFILYHALRNGSAPGKIFALLCVAFPDVPRQTLKETMLTFYRRFFTQQFKRNCLPDGVKIGAVCLSPRGDWRMPSEASARAWLCEAEEL